MTFKIVSKIEIATPSNEEPSFTIIGEVKEFETKIALGQLNLVKNHLSNKNFNFLKLKILEACNLKT